jgi:acetyl esterase/lipase
MLLACCGASGGTVEHVPNLAYASDGLDAHRLDLYLPADRALAPVVVFVHGGAFMQGDRADYAAVVSYRLFPQTDAAGATQDVANAVAWVVLHATDYGLSAKNLFLVGHSAGGQIVALLGVDAGYLAAAGSSPDVLRGVVAVAGAYDLRDLSDESDEFQKIDAHIFGSTPERRALVSPSLHVRAGAPPTIAVCGTRDDPEACDRATIYVRSLVTAGSTAYAIRVVGADHMGTLRSLVTAGDPLNAAFHDFVTQHSLP